MKRDDQDTPNRLDGDLWREHMMEERRERNAAAAPPKKKRILPRRKRSWFERMREAYCRFVGRN